MGRRDRHGTHRKPTSDSVTYRKKGYCWRTELRFAHNGTQWENNSLKGTYNTGEINPSTNLRASAKWVRSLLQGLRYQWAPLSPFQTTPDPFPLQFQPSAKVAWGTVPLRYWPLPQSYQPQLHCQSHQLQVVYRGNASIQGQSFKNRRGGSFV